MLRTLVAALMIAAAPAVAKDRNPLIDYAGFQQLTKDVSAYRQGRLLSWDEFEKAGRQPRTLILDARSADAFAAGHIEGAVNLPFTDFTAASLARVIGDKDRQILIYCNNNFSNNKAPVETKAVRLALNIQTFINLVGYGYANVRELNEVVDFNDPKVGWVKGTSPSGNRT
ncbi:MAG TPA: rhodanese-like domain-containing protein [Sphingomicrobium sp.]|jgi:phage shock protein E|nr:rhodanese-like domain-containing protein [Sphingomicrobium sp.]